MTVAPAILFDGIAGYLAYYPSVESDAVFEAEFIVNLITPIPSPATIYVANRAVVSVSVDDRAVGGVLVSDRLVTTIGGP
jgi:hypothetical protein